jgi:hypothetical protein
MFFDEKIAVLKKKFSNAEFSIPFSDGSQVLKSIEKKFIVVKDLQKDLNNLRQHHNCWAENIKHLVELKTIELHDTQNLLSRLDTGLNYWIVLVMGALSASRHMVYNCKPVAIAALISLTQEDFYVVDKKYRWLTYFKVDRQKGNLIIYKSGQATTPFEE